MSIIAKDLQRSKPSLVELGLFTSLSCSFVIHQYFGLQLEAKLYLVAALA